MARRSEYPDPLFVYPPSAAIAELEEFLADKEERLRCNFPYLVPIAPDYYHKEDVSGGMWYNVSVPAVADDPPLNDEPHHLSFLNPRIWKALRFNGQGFSVGLSRWRRQHVAALGRALSVGLATAEARRKPISVAIQRSCEESESAAP